MNHCNLRIDLSPNTPPTPWFDIISRLLCSSVDLGFRNPISPTFSWRRSGCPIMNDTGTWCTFSGQVCFDYSHGYSYKVQSRHHDLILNFYMPFVNESGSGPHYSRTWYRTENKKHQTPILLFHYAWLTEVAMQSTFIFPIWSGIVSE